MGFLNFSKLRKEKISNMLKKNIFLTRPRDIFEKMIFFLNFEKFQKPIHTALPIILMVNPVQFEHPISKTVGGDTFGVFTILSTARRVRGYCAHT